MTDSSAQTRLARDPEPRLPDLDQRALNSLVHDDGRRYADYRSSLRPRWSRVWRDIVLGYAALAATAGLIVAGSQWMPAATYAWLLLGAISFGYWMAYLQLFLHEAAHYNIYPDRHWNDLLANATISCWIGTPIADYRRVHWEHHRLHGEPGDTEHSYFFPLDARFIVGSLTGWHALRVLLFRSERTSRSASKGSGRPAMLLLAAALHGSVVFGALLAGGWMVAAAWIAGIGMFFPFFGALRQLLEHRSTAARGDVDYSTVAHGRTNRMFEEGPVASTLGGAGFTRHLLHHWEPQLSYTNLRELEEFLNGCAITRGISGAKTTYWRTFRLLYGR